jgi:catechol 2,3-dioxygenase-like lactoylglutathione lyase family enzyme
MTAPALDHVGLTVGDLPAMSSWYAAALGLDVEFEFALDHVDFRGMMLRSPAGYRIELLHRPESVTGLQAANPVEAALIRGFGHLALDVPSVDAAYAALLAAGASDRMSPRPSPEPGVRMAYVADPEGNLLELLDRTTSLEEAPSVEERADELAPSVEERVDELAPSVEERGTSVSKPGAPT